MRIHALDVRHTPQIERLGQAVATEGIDVLIHNAGVAGRGLAAEEMRRINTERKYPSASHRCCCRR